MTVYEAARLARTLMTAYQLRGWSFKFTTHRRVFGSCHYQLKLISLSAPLTECNPESEVRDTILHEIAHALTPGQGHNAVWKTMARRIGAKPNATYTHEGVDPVPTKYVSAFEYENWKKSWKSQWRGDD